MSEEEIIKEVESAIWFMKEDNYNVNTLGKAIQGLLDLYNKEKETSHYIQSQLDIANAKLIEEKEKNKELLENATVTYFNDEELKESVGNYLGVLLKKNIEKDYISKDKIRKKISVLEKIQSEFTNNEELRIKIITLKDLLLEEE